MFKPYLYNARVVVEKQCVCTCFKLIPCNTATQTENNNSDMKRNNCKSQQYH